MPTTPANADSLFNTDQRPLMTCQPLVIQALWALHERALVALARDGWTMKARTHPGGQAGRPAGTWTFGRRGHVHWSNRSAGEKTADLCLVWLSDILPDQTTPVIDEVALEDEPTVSTLEGFLTDALGARPSIDVQEVNGGWSAVLVGTSLGPRFPQQRSSAASTAVEAKGRLVADALIAIARKCVAETPAVNAEF